MDWYIVIKTIGGRRYYYRQKTWREGKRVRTRSEYIGPVGDGPKPDDLSGAVTLPLPFPSSAEYGADETIALLVNTSKRLESWSSSWNEGRQGKSIVRQDRRIQNLLKELRVVRTNRADSASYDPRSDRVNLPPPRCYFDVGNESATEGYYTTLLHEIVHWTMHKTRLNRFEGAMLYDRSFYAREELVAELGSVMLLRHFELIQSDLSIQATYFQTWLDRAGNREEALAHAKREAVRAVHFILNRGIISK